jgi:hypothetical protein
MKQSWLINTQEKIISQLDTEKVAVFRDNSYLRTKCAFFKARATKERVPLIKARMNGRCLHASGSYNIFCSTKIKLIFFVLIH